MMIRINRRSALAMSALALVSPVLAEETKDKGKAMLEAASPLGDRVLGKADAPVVLIEYASATCPHCAEFHETLLPQIKA